MNHARRLPQRFSLQVVKGVRLLHRSVLHTCTYIIRIISLLAIYIVGVEWPLGKSVRRSMIESKVACAF